ncbi:MAG TPA: transposase [Spirochaetota bacterium]|nr:transposase [Spirochaetota bacterium]
MRKQYDKEFKINAVRLYEESGKLLREVEQELGVGTGCISHWRKELQDQGELSFPGNGKLNEKDAEMARLKRELEIVKQERDILKKAVGIFSNHSK